MNKVALASKLMPQFFFLFLSFFSFAQKDIDVVLKWETTKEYQVCRYCNEKAHKTYLNRVYFEDDKYTIPYKAALQRYYKAGLLSVAFDSDQMSSECDISRSGRHGIEKSTEDFVKTEIVKLSELEKYVEEQKKQDELAEKKRLENERILSLNMSMAKCLDSIDFYYQDIGNTGNNRSQILMAACLTKLLKLQYERDQTESYEMSKLYKIEIKGNSQGYGYIYKDYKWKDLYRKWQFALLFTNNFELLFEVSDDLSLFFDSYDLRAWAFFGKGEIDSAVFEFTRYLNTAEASYPSPCEKIATTIKDIQINKDSYFYIIFHDDPHFTGKNLVELQIKLMASTSKDKYCRAEDNYYRGITGLTILEVSELLSLSQSQIKKLLKNGSLSYLNNDQNQLISSSSVLTYYYKQNINPQKSY